MKIQVNLIKRTKPHPALPQAEPKRHHLLCPVGSHEHNGSQLFSWAVNSPTQRIAPVKWHNKTENNILEYP